MRRHQQRKQKGSQQEYFSSATAETWFDAFCQVDVDVATLNYRVAAATVTRNALLRACCFNCIVADFFSAKSQPGEPNAQSAEAAATSTPATDSASGKDAS